MFTRVAALAAVFATSALATPRLHAEAGGEVGAFLFTSPNPQLPAVGVALALGAQLTDEVSISVTAKGHELLPYLWVPPVFSPGLRFELAPEAGRFSIAFAASTVIAFGRVAGFTHIVLSTRAAWDFGQQLLGLASFRLALEFATLVPAHPNATIGFAPMLSAGVVWR